MLHIIGGLRDFIGKRRSLVIFLTFIVCVLFTVGVVSHRGQYFDSDPQKIRLKIITGASGRLKYQHVLLPTGFKTLKSVLGDHLRGTSAETWNYIQHAITDILQLPPIEPTLFKLSSLKLFRSSRDDLCDSKKHEFDIYTGDSILIPLNLTALFKIFQEEEDIYGDSYNKHIGHIFKDHMTEDSFSKNWFVFSGSSVWLRAYNVHLVVSRLVFSEIESRQDPRLSLVIAQIFDEGWREIEDVRLVFPTNDVGNPQSFKVGDTTFMLYRFPRILPTPFLLGDSGRFWGAEDPRTFLVQNKDGYDEPVIVFNAAQAKQLLKEDEIEVQSLRSMFLSFPFQTQQGKGIYTLESETEKQWFSLTKQIKIRGQQENSVEKNWTPLVDTPATYRDIMYFATLLAPFKIVKCELWTDNQDCLLLHADQGDGIGALRGGTPFIRVMLIEEENKEVFVGLARAHLSDCGCGSAFYRPNIVVVARKNTQWMMSHVSSSIDLGMPIIPWNKGGRVCEGVNAMIPNGIENWDFDSDKMTVFVSISDITVERVTVSGVLEALKQIKFWEEEKDEHTVDPMDCAMGASRQFCEDYGKVMEGKSRHRDQMSVFEV